MSFPRKLSALAVASTMAVTGVTMATPALANTGTSSQPAAAAPAINPVSYTHLTLPTNREV